MPRVRPYFIPKSLYSIQESEIDMSVNNDNQNNAMNSANNTSSTVRNIVDSLRIPDAVKDLPKFDGNARLLYDFINNVEEILSILSPIDGTPFAKMILRSIRNKVEGEANEILNMYSTDLSWQSIKNNLILHYSDKRNETSLIRDLHLLKQNNKTLEEFYSSVVEIQATINNHLMIHEEDPNIIAAKKDLFAKMCLNTFLSGLKEPLGSSIRAMKPETLPMAFSYCITEQNMFYIRQESRNLVRRQETYRTYNPQQLYSHYQRPLTPRSQPTNNYRPQQNMNYSPPIYYNRPQLPPNQSFTRPQLAHNFNSPTPRQPYYHTAPNNQNQFNNFKQPQLNTNTNYQTPEPMDTSSGYTHLRNNSGQTRRLPREIHHFGHNSENPYDTDLNPGNFHDINHNFGNFDNYYNPEDYDVPSYVPDMDNYNEVEDVGNFQLDASKTQQDT